MLLLYIWQLVYNIQCICARRIYYFSIWLIVVINLLLEPAIDDSGRDAANVIEFMIGNPDVNILNSYQLDILRVTNLKMVYFKRGCKNRYKS